MLLKKSQSLSANTRAFHKKIQSFSQRYGLWKRNSHILIGVSGGPDSMTLLHFFLFLREKYNLTLSVAHVNYALRGEESDQDEQLVRTYCKENNLSFFIHRPQCTRRDENFLRDIRFAFFSSLYKNKKETLLALAHHQDDQVETILHRLLRGSGSRGLSGMLPKNNHIIRPFLSTPKKDLLDYCQDNAIPYRIDKTNKELFYTRNKIRNAILPFLEEYNPNIRTTLTRTALLSAQDEEYMEEELLRQFQPHFSQDGVSFSLSQWDILPKALKTRALRQCITLVSEKKLLKNISFSLIEEIWNALEHKKSKSQEIRFLDLILKRSNDTVHLFSGKKITKKVD